MPTTLQSPVPRRNTFALVSLGVLVALCTIPIVVLFTAGAWLGRGCTTNQGAVSDGGLNFVWRIDTERCGDGPLVTNVLVAPRGKTLALAASSTGSPRPVAVYRTADGNAVVELEARPGAGPATIMLPLKASGRPASPLVLADGNPKR